MSAGSGQVAAACDGAWFVLAPVASAIAPWTAPASGGACATFSTAQAAGSTDFYHSATVRGPTR
jgi:hypothetical protein